MTVQITQAKGVLVFGCSDGLANSGLKADEKAIAAQQVSVATVSTGSAIRSGEDNMDYKVVKIGALFSEESIKLVSTRLQKHTQLMSVMDVEPFFKTGTAPKPEVISALRKDILPSITILSATVPEVKALLNEAGIPIDYPKSIQDVQSMAKTLRSLGPEYVVIKREIFDESDGATTLHFVLCGSEEPLTVTSRCENPKRLLGASYSIPGK
ncbi:pyridoxamine kinase [Trichoderma barbatum]